MAEETWLSFVTNFITNDERMALDIPADQEMASFDGGNGYKLATLETSLATIDTSTLKRFRQGTILSNALAKRVVELAKFSSSSSSEKSTKAKKEILANEKTPKNQPTKTTGRAAAKTFVPIEGKLLTGPALKALDFKGSLPQKAGKPDLDVYKLYKEHSLRKKLWDRLSAAQCLRCGDANHTRTDCPRPRAGFEDDVDKGLVFWKLQHRPQWTMTEEVVDDASGSPTLPPSRSRVLAVITATGLAGVDTLSDINTALSSVLLNVRPCSTVCIQHVGGSTPFRLEGELLVGTSNGNAVYITCFAATKHQLPESMVAIFGMPAIASLRISLDFVVTNPLCLWTAASSLPSISSDHDGPLDFLDAAFFDDSDSESDSELPDLLAISSDGSTVSTESTAPVLDFDASLIPEPEPVQHTPSPDVSMQPSWLARLVMFLALLLAACLPLRSPHRDALLPGSSNSGHSLFQEPPYAVWTDLWWAPRDQSPPPDFDDFVFEPSVYFDDPSFTFGNISKVVQPLSMCHPPWAYSQLCFPQLSQSAFTGGRALRATAAVLPDGYTEPLEISVGVDTLSDVNLSLRHLLSDVSPIAPDDVRGTGSITTFQRARIPRHLRRRPGTTCPRPCRSSFYSP